MAGSATDSNTVLADALHLPATWMRSNRPTTVTLDIAKDNAQFGLRAVDKDGNRSPVAFPKAVTT